MLRSRRARELSALAALGIGVAAYVAGRFWLQHFIPLIGLACVAAVALCAGLRLWVGAAGWAIAAAVALAAVIPAYLPREAVVRPGCRLSVVEFNKQEEHPDDAGAARLLARLHPDLLFAEKVYDTSGFRDVLLAAGFAGYYSFPSQQHPDLILSRFPIVRTGDEWNWFWADIAVEGREVRLENMYATRPTADWRQHLEDMAWLRARARDRHGPLILAGDANATPFAREVRELREVLPDTWDEAGWGLGATFPGPWRRAGLFGPWLRIDYIFHNAAFDAVSARRIDEAAGAGHYPVWAELALAGAGTPGEPCR